MDRQILSKRITDILDDINRLKNALYALDMTDIQRYPDNYEVLSTDAAIRGERIACRLRHLIYSTTSIKKADFLKDVAQNQGIRIENKEGIMQITLPSLLPKRKQQRNTEFLIDPFYFAFSQYADTNPIQKYRECIVCFSHVYSRELPTRRIRDYDNIELKQILDVIATFIMLDDSGLLCDAYNTTELGDEDCTRIFVMDKSLFPKWLAMHQNSIKTISDF